MAQSVSSSSIPSDSRDSDYNPYLSDPSVNQNSNHSGSPSICNSVDWSALAKSSDSSPNVVPQIIEVMSSSSIHSQSSNPEDSPRDYSDEDHIDTRSSSPPIPSQLLEVGPSRSLRPGLGKYISSLRAKIPRPKRRSSRIKDIELEEVCKCIPVDFDDVQEMARLMGLEGLTVVPGVGEDRAHHSSKGTCFYWKSPKWGVILPFSPFVLSVLQSIDVAPSQLHPIAWCNINSFEAYFVDNASRLNNAEPTLGLFLDFFEFTITPRSKS